MQLQVFAGSHVLYVRTRARNHAHRRAPGLIVGWFLPRSSASFCRLADRQHRGSRIEPRVDPTDADVLVSVAIGGAVKSFGWFGRRRRWRAPARPEQVTAAGRQSAPTLRCLSRLRGGARNRACVCAFSIEFQTLGGGVSPPYFCHCLHPRSHCTSAGGSSVAERTHTALRAPRSTACSVGPVCVLECESDSLPGGLVVAGCSPAWANTVWREAAADVCCVTG